MQTPSLNEDHSSQIPAIQFLINLGYEYIGERKAIEKRENKTSIVLLEDILKNQLIKLNSFERKGKEYKFSDNNISNAILTLKNTEMSDGFINTNKKIYELLLFGIAYEETVNGDKKSHTLKFIDWDTPSNNHFHITEEYSVLRENSSKHYRPDIVLFINGIPFIIIECKSPTLDGNKTPNELGQEQNIRNQKKDGIRSLYVYSQIVMSLAVNECSYATTGTPKEFWSVWKEQYKTKENPIGSSEEEFENQVANIKNQPLSFDAKEELFSDRFKYVKNYFDELENHNRKVTAQDRMLFSLCEQSRVLDLIKNFILFDKGIKKIARYQQYFAIKNTMNRISKFDNTGRREGGVIWHTQGSGKSLTMVLLARAIMKASFKNCKIILVTDRVDLDKQIGDTFKNTENDVIRATSGTKLTELLAQPTDAVITTVINKFESAVKQIKYPFESTEIFVLIDEGHRTQYGSFNVSMQRVFPNACYLAFTGTPLMKKEKLTAKKFGGFIGNPYTVKNAVEDGAVVPLLYEGRHNRFDINDSTVNRFFDIITENVSDEGKAKLKRKFNSKVQLNKADLIIMERAIDIGKHYREFFQTNQSKYKAKAQLVAPSIKTALKYKKYLNEYGGVRSDIIVTRTDDREGDIDSFENLNEDKRIENEYFDDMVDKFGTIEKYEDAVINQFKNDDYPEILIVVAKLLTGFDAPVNTVLYLCKSLKEHTLLQAIARVNRKYPGKEYGYIIDYYGNLENLDDAIETYSGLDSFDSSDLEGTLTDINEELLRLPQVHSNLIDIFKDLNLKLAEITEYEEVLAEKNIRDDFYLKVKEFAKLFKMALSSVKFMKETKDSVIEMYKNDAKKYLKLRKDVMRRFNDELSWKEFEPQIQNLIDKHISTDGEIERITEEFDLFNKEERDREVERIVGEGAKADHIASRTIKAINVKIDEDPIYYRKFAELIRETIREYREQRITAIEYLNRTKEFENKFHDGRKDGMPSELINNEMAQAFYNYSMNTFSSDFHEKFHIDLGLKIDTIIKNKLFTNDILRVDWQKDEDLIKSIMTDVEDEIVNIHKVHKLNVDWDKVDIILEGSIRIAKASYN